MSSLVIAIIIIIILCYLTYSKHKKRCKSFPPGPPSLPIVGSIPFLNAKKGIPDAITKECSKDYKDQKLFTVWMGPLSIVVIQDFELCKGMFSRDEFSGRPNTYPEKYVRGINGTPLGIVATEGKFWQEQRRFTLKHLKDFGFGRNKLDEAIHEEVNYLLEDLLIQSKYGDILVENLFNFPIINILWKIVASKRYDPNLPESKEMMKGVGVLFTEGPPLIVFFIQNPTIRKMIRSKGERGELKLKELLRSQVYEHQKELKLDPSTEPKDFIDIYLKEIEATGNTITNRPDGDLENFNSEQLVSICMDLFQAGSETSSTTLSWAVMALALYPDVQEKCYEEINTIIGEKLLSKSDASRLTYCMATIQEIQRISRVAPGSLFHATSKDIVVEGYNLKKGQILLANLTTFMNDPEVFPEPKKFQPERFLQDESSSNGVPRKLKTINQFVPFGLGKRICPGESLAISEIFIFFVMFIQRVKILLPHSHSKPSFDNYKSMFTTIPQPFYISIESR